MAVTNFIGDGIVDQNGDYLWADPSNWDAGTPQYGETAVLDGTLIPPQDPNFSVPVISMYDLGLSGLTIDCRNIILDANFLTLSHTTITSVDDVNSIGSGLEANTLLVGGHSFVGVAAGQIGGNFELQANNIINYGTIGAESGGGNGVVIQVGPSGGELDNEGHIVATGGSSTALVSEYVVGGGNAIVSQGGTLLLLSTTLFNNVAMSGASASTFEFDPATSSFYGNIHGFAVTDFIHLDNFIMTGSSQTGSVNPALTLTGTDGGVATSVTLDFTGNFSHAGFGFAPDAQGTGTLLSLTHI